MGFYGDSRFMIADTYDSDAMSQQYLPAEPYQQAVSILGAQLNPVSVPDVHHYINRVIDRKQRALILHLNIHGVNLCQKYPWLTNFVNQAQMVFCDGDGVRWGARLLGFDAPPKITYDRWIWQLAELADQRGYRLFLLGGKPGVADAAAEKIRQRFAGLEIAGTQHGYFKKNGTENEEVIAKINETKPDVLVVGFGMPIQEKWLRDHWHKVECHVFLTGGAVLDYAAGNAKRAPKWMIRGNLEWLFRLVQEPRRLCIRYLWGNPSFMARILWSKWFKGGAVK
jgi:N-acetylglucosaminyldiphosphoundecaprenol N-acetyl-beta-D-mannosaminyltransferase